MACNAKNKGYDLKKLAPVFKQCPGFGQWVEDKKLKASEISILTEFLPKQAPLELLKWIGRHKPSHSEGAQILELACELILMRRPVKDLLLKETKAPALLQLLRKRRFAHTSARDQQKAQAIASLPWPDSIKARWIRENDRGALSIQFKSFSLRDFRQKIQKLEAVRRELEKGPHHF